MSKPAILLHKDDLNTIGIEIKPIAGVQKIIQELHRDDHYMFVVQDQGKFLWELDFINIVLNDACLFFVLPGQVHRYINNIANNNCTGWLVFVDTKFVSKPYREIFDSFFPYQQAINERSNDSIFELTAVLEGLLNDKTKSINEMILSSLIDVIIGMFAEKFLQNKNSSFNSGSQKNTIATKFKQVIREKYKQYKQVKDFANLLNITPLYLNEVIKEITGFVASYWIQQEVILEAKRLLYYTDLNVKEIAYELGYEDHTYFSRFFKKNTGLTASEFRTTKP